MTAQVLSFFQRSPRFAPKPADWSQQELAEFYRVENALIRAGIRVGTDRGMSDENEPWFCFYRSDDGEVVIHFARIDGEYVIAGPAYEEIARGFDFSSLVRNMVARHPLIRRGDSGSNISVHPAALLVAVVGTAFFKTGEARAAETGATNPHASHSKPVLLSSSSVGAGVTGAVSPAAFLPGYDAAQIPANQAVLILAAALLASDYGVDTTHLDPGARAALAATAAALDFGSAPASTAFDESGGVLASAARDAAVDNSPAHTVSSVLSLVALLSTAPPSEAPTALESLKSGGLDEDPHVAAQHAPSNEAANWAIEVRLGPGVDGLPSVDAVELVRGLTGEGAQKISVIEVGKLPNVLADLIAKGDHYTVGAPAAPAQADKPAASADPAPTLPPSHGQGPSGASPLPADPDPAPPAEPAQPAFASPALVKQFIDYFLAHAPSVEVMATGSDIVMFDSRVLHNVGAISHLDSINFEFADGSSISLVGEHSALHNGMLF